MGKKDNAVHIMCILDRSGSMMSMASEVINSFNEFLKEQKAEKGKAFLTLVLFDDKYEVVYDRINLKKADPIDASIYFARGMTAMNDAIGKTIMANTDKDAMVLIQTDGMENASHEYKNADIKRLVKEKEDIGWEFVFLGANIDTMQEGHSRGISALNSVSFEANDEGVKVAYASMDGSLKSYRGKKLGEWEDSK